MQIKSITIEGVSGEIEIVATEHGALVTCGICGDRVICEVREKEHREDRFAKAMEVAKHIYGVDRKGRVSATNSMIHEVFNEIDRVAGC